MAARPGRAHSLSERQPALTLRDRVEAFKQAYPKWPASWPWLVEEQDRDVIYAVWVIGATWGNETAYYGAYPRSYLDRVQALFPDVVTKTANLTAAPGVEWPILHAFSGSVPAGPYDRLDVRYDAEAGVTPDRIGSVYDAATLFAGRRAPFDLVLADPAYTAEDATQYGNVGIHRARAVKALAGVTAPGGHLVWLDTQWPIHDKTQWVTVGRIFLVRSTNHRFRGVTILERV